MVGQWHREKQNHRNRRQFYSQTFGLHHALFHFQNQHHHHHDDHGKKGLACFRFEHTTRRNNHRINIKQLMTKVDKKQKTHGWFIVLNNTKQHRKTNHTYISIVYSSTHLQQKQKKRTQRTQKNGFKTIDDSLFFFFATFSWRAAPWLAPTPWSWTPGRGPLFHAENLMFWLRIHGYHRN